MSFLRSGRRLRDSTPEAPTAASPNEEAEIDAQEIFHPVYAVVYKRDLEDLGFKHWVVFVQDTTDSSKSFICNVEGTAGTFRYALEYEDVRTSGKAQEIIQVGRVSFNNLKALRHVAKAEKINNNDPAWNCQDFIWFLIKSLAAEGLLDKDDDLYKDGTKTLWTHMEGLIE